MLKNLRIAGRLMIGFGMLLVMTAAIASYTVWASRDASELFDRVTRFKSNEVNDEIILKSIF